VSISDRGACTSRAQRRSGRHGQLHGRGWSVRWRWHGTGALEFRATHRMTNERWHVIDRDGTMTTKPVPAEMMVFAPGENRAKVESDYGAAWRAHGEALKRDDMEWDATEEALQDVAAHWPRRDDIVAWKLDDSSWSESALAPRIEP